MFLRRIFERIDSLASGHLSVGTSVALQHFPVENSD